MNITDLLFDSCSVMRNYSAKCTYDYLAHNSTTSTHALCCEWYHGVWQYLRALDCVSAPQWHEEFYTREFVDAARFANDSFSVLISGTADYSILYLLINALKNSKKRIEIDIVDLCDTPINICEWYIARFREEDKEICGCFSFHMYRSNIALFDRGKKYDLICSDAFLTRFSSDETKSVVNKWRQLLNDDGRVVTTVRLYNDSNIVKPSFEEEANNIHTFLRKVFTKYELLSNDQKKKFCISSNELSFLAARYIVNMLSNPHGNEHDIDLLFKESGLSIIPAQSQIHKVPGEVRETEYYQIVAKKIGDINNG